MGKPAGSLHAQPRIWTRGGTGRALDSRLPDYKSGAVTARSRYLLYILKYFLMLKLSNTKNVCETKQFVGMKKKKEKTDVKLGFQCDLVHMSLASA